MGEHLDDLGDAEVAVAFFDATDRLGEYRRTFDVPDRIRLLADEERSLYAALGIGRGAVTAVWGRRTLVRYARLIRAGRTYTPHDPGTDTLQLGGDVVIGPDGRIASLHRPPDPDSRPSVEELVAAVAATGDG